MEEDDGKAKKSWSPLRISVTRPNDNDDKYW